jgi:hypothetical protein
MQVEERRKNSSPSLHVPVAAHQGAVVRVIHPATEGPNAGGEGGC